MKQSKLFTHTIKEVPKDEVSLNAQLLVKAGYIFKEMAGVYSFLPLGFKVLNKIEQIIREEMDNIGGVEMRTSVFQNKEVWQKSNRWDDKVVDNWFKTKLKNGGEVGLSFTNEEAYANILKQYINSYKDLPVYPYDFKTIFRNEVRSKSGIFRGREFYWKALYSFSKNEEEHNEFYEQAKTAYQNVFQRVGIGDLTYLTFASGGSFSKFSHEFQTVTDAGEDLIYIDKAKGIAVNKEVYTDEVLKSLELDKKNLVQKKAVEVGNIFSLGTKFSSPFNLKYKKPDGQEELVIMGSYGIGLGRLMGTIVEVLADDQGIIWPPEVTPCHVHLLDLTKSNQAEELYNELSKNYDILYDDRDESPGVKLKDADLIGITIRIVVSEKNKGKYEVKQRGKDKLELLNMEGVKKYLKVFYK